MISINKSKIIWLIAAFFFPLVASACPDQLAVLPGSWDEGNGKFSLTVQAQDSSGELCKVGETLRLGFSGPGRFSNEGDTSEPQAYISKNSSNRNFYYHGSTGDTITIRAGFGTATDWTESWQTSFTIGNNSNNQLITDADQTSDDSDYSVFSTQAEVSSFATKKNWQIGIGKDRSVLAGSRVAFKIDDNANNQQAIYQWSFGDGARVRGKVASHTYRHPGTYLVVVTADNRAGQEAVARIKVKVSAPKVAVSFLDSTGSVKLANKNGEEINLGSFSLTADGQKPFVFPADTIIGVGQEIVIDESISGLAYDDYLVLFDPTGRVVAESGLAALKREEAMAKLEQLQSSLREAQTTLASTQVNQRLVAVSAPSANPPSLAEASNTPNTIVLEREGDSLLSWLRKLFKL
jgi:hypothetical protein